MRKKIKNQIPSPIYRLTAKTGARNLVLPAEAVTIHKKRRGRVPSGKCLLSTCCFHCNRIKIRLQAQIDGGPAKKKRHFSTLCTKTAVTACFRAEARSFRAASRTAACRRCIPARRRSARARRGSYAIFPDSRDSSRQSRAAR